jgi:hypothetical protein
MNKYRPITISIYTNNINYKNTGWLAQNEFELKEFLLSVPWLSEDIIYSVIKSIENQIENDILFPNVVVFLDEKFNRLTIDKFMAKKRFSPLRWFEDHSNYFVSLLFLYLSMYIGYITIYYGIIRHDDIIVGTVGMLFSLAMLWMSYVFWVFLEYRKPQ